MRAPNNLHCGDVGFNMTPMIDIVFLLIIFFLVSSHLARQEVQLQLDLPEASSGQRDQDDETRRLTVNVTPEGQILLSGRSVTPAQLGEMIGHENRRARGRVEVRIRTDQSIPFRVVEPIMLACVRAGVWNVTFGVVRGEQP